MGATYEILSAENPQWQRDAVRLAHQRTPFAVKGLTQALDQLFENVLKVAYNLDISVNRETDTAYFTPKGS